MCKGSQKIGVKGHSLDANFQQIYCRFGWTVPGRDFVCLESQYVERVEAERWLNDGG